MFKHLIIASLVGSALTAFAVSFFSDASKDLSPEKARSQLIADYRRDPASTLKRVNKATRPCLKEQGRSEYSPKFHEVLNRVLIAVFEANLKGGSGDEMRTSVANLLQADIKDMVRNFSEAERNALLGEIKSVSGNAFGKCVVVRYASQSSQT